MSPTVAPLSAENHAPSTACPGLIFYYLWAKRTNVETETVLDGMNSHHFLHHCLFFPVDWKTKGLVPLNLTLGGQTILSRRCQLNPAAGDGRLCLCQAAVFSSAILLFLCRFVRELRLILAAGLDHIASEKVLSCPVPCCPHYSTPTWITKSSTPSPSQNRRRQKVRPPNKSGGFRVVKNVDSTQKYFQGRLSRTPSIGPSTTAVHRQTLQIVHR